MLKGSHPEFDWRYRWRSRGHISHFSNDLHRQSYVWTCTCYYFICAGTIILSNFDSLWNTTFPVHYLPSSQRQTVNACLEVIKVIHIVNIISACSLTEQVDKTRWECWQSHLLTKLLMQSSIHQLDVDLQVKYLLNEKNNKCDEVTLY